MAKVLQRPPRENVTPLVLEKTVWAGANLGSYQQAAAAIGELAEINLAPKQLQRITSQIGEDCVQERREAVEEHRERPLMERVAAPAGVEAPELAVVMMDGGRFQRRDHFQERKSSGGEEDSDPSRRDRSATAPSSEKTTHWREDKVGIVLSMKSDVHDADPAPDFPAWLAGAEVVAELAKLAAREEEIEETATDDSAPVVEGKHEAFDWRELAPELLSREVITSSEEAEDFGRHLEWKAWMQGVFTAKRQAFVADGLAVNWSIHKRHFSQTTPILDLMHALSYAWRAAAGLDDPCLYGRWAEWIWQGRVDWVIGELEEHQERIGAPPPEASAGDPRQRLARAITYYTNHKGRMRYQDYRRRGLPLTSSHIESTIKSPDPPWRADQRPRQRDREVLEGEFRQRGSSTPRRLPQRHATPRLILDPLEKPTDRNERLPKSRHLTMQSGECTPRDSPAFPPPDWRESWNSIKSFQQFIPPRRNKIATGDRGCGLDNRTVRRSLARQNGCWGNR